MITRKVQVTICVEVTIDETKFGETFLRNFRENFYNFRDVDRHIEHLAQMHARDLYDDTDFIEGYGQASDMGIQLKDLGVHDIEILREAA